MGTFTAFPAFLQDETISFYNSYKDKRISNQALKLFSKMINCSSSCLRKLAGCRKTEVAFGRLLRNKRFTVEPIVSKAIEKTKILAKESKHVLLIQDSVFLYFGQRGKTKVKGLGVGGNDGSMGFYQHPMIAIDADDKTCYGLAAFYQWVRCEETEKTRGDSAPRFKLPISEKESFRWIQCANESKKIFNEKTIKTVIADRESDIYEEHCLVPDKTTQILTRASHNRKLANGEYLFETLKKTKTKGKIKVFLPAITGKRKARVASLNVRFKKVEVRKPARAFTDGIPKTASLYAIEIEEISEYKDRIHWFF